MGGTGGNEVERAAGELLAWYTVPGGRKKVKA